MMTEILRRIPNRLNETIAKQLLNNVENFLFDCDGVIWHWPNAISGSVECINKLKTIGKKCFFLTNNSTKTRKMYVEQMKFVGIDNVNEDDIVCTAWLLASYLKSINFKDKVYIVGNSSIGKELDDAGIDHVGIGPTFNQIPDPSVFNYKNELKLDPSVKCVAVGFDYHFSYPKMLLATSYGYKPNCLFVATNEDSVFPSESDEIVIPGTGTFVSALRTSLGREPVVLGKPHNVMWNLLKQTHNLSEINTCMVGDRLDTDIAFGTNCNLKYTLAVLSGITNENEILNYSSETNNLLRQKCVPDFYTNSLGDLGNFISIENEN